MALLPPVPMIQYYSTYTRVPCRGVLAFRKYVPYLTGTGSFWLYWFILQMTDLLSGNLLILSIAPTLALPRQKMAHYDLGCACWEAAPSSIAQGCRRRSSSPLSSLSTPSASCDNNNGVSSCRGRPAIAAVPAVAAVAPVLLLLLLLLRMPFPLEAEAPTAVVVPRATAAYPAPPNQNGRRCWLLAHTSMAMVHIFVITLMPPPPLLLLPLFSSLSSFLQSLSPPPPVTAAIVGVHVDLHDHPPQQPLTCDCQCHCLQ